jgi:tetratricopeptide (TPR) repeat protein
LEQDPKDPITLYEYATFLELCGQRDLAEDYFLQVLEIDPDFIEALYHYGLLLESKNEFNYAEKFYMRISQAPKG